MTDRESQMHEAATMYYLQDATMESVARHLGMSRSGVSRLLKAAREQGVVRIQVRATPGGSDLVTQVEATFGVRAHVVPVRLPAPDEVRLEHVSRYAAQLLPEWFSDGMTMGVAWGTTVAAVAAHLRHSPRRDAVVVQLNGAANTLASGLAYGSDLVSQIAWSFDAAAHHFPVPAFFDFAATRDLMWRERSVRHVLALQSRTDLAVFGVGALEAPVPSHVYTSGYLDDADRESLAADGVVGDVCTVFLREGGTWEDIEINARATGPNPRQLAQLHRRVCIVAGEAKVVPLLAALRAGVVTDLVVDSPTASALLRRAGVRLPRSPL